jgi:hypothetical protein
MNEPSERKDVRASDLDRETIAEQLRMAAGDGRLDFDELDERLDAAYGAKTYGELEPLVADLPGARHPTPSRAVAQPPPRAGMPVGGRAYANPAIAIFGGSTRKGSWVVPRSFKAFALFGGVEIDLRDASLEDREVTIIANAIFGGVDITVPEGVAVITSGAGIMGGYDGPSDDGGAPDGPVIHIKGVAIFGGVDVRRKPPSTPKQPRRSNEVHGGTWAPQIPPPSAPPAPPHGSQGPS